MNDSCHTSQNLDITTGRGLGDLDNLRQSPMNITAMSRAQLSGGYPELFKGNSHSHGGMSLPEVTIIDSSTVQMNTEGKGDSAEYCLVRALESPQKLPVFTALDLANCDDKFKTLLQDMDKNPGLTPKDQSDRAETARQIIDYTRKDDQYRELLQPFMEHLFEVAYQK